MPTKYESYETGDSNTQSVYSTEYKGQTFTPQIAHAITSVELYLYRNAVLGNVDFCIYNTSGSLPTGTAVATATVDASAWATTVAWHGAIFGSSVNLNASVEYAIELSQSADAGSAPNSVKIRYDATGSYSRGQHVYSGDSGSTWAANTAHDYLFIESGNPTDVARMGSGLFGQSQSPEWGW